METISACLILNDSLLSFDAQQESYRQFWIVLCLFDYRDLIDQQAQKLSKRPMDKETNEPSRRPTYQPNKPEKQNTKTQQVGWLLPDALLKVESRRSWALHVNYWNLKLTTGMSQ